MPEPIPALLRTTALGTSPLAKLDIRTPVPPRGNRRPPVQASPARARRVPPPVRNLPRRYGN
ncbi:hypothetical protein ACQEU8_22740 [Streptomyces sp. CA-250714]|uniref:hypothetical protein n=1 Tax=Streptomyces sp. CA-250714 TaxID=3240060 RepID=UPI003D8ABAA4